MLISVEEEELSSVVTSEQEFVFQEYAVKYVDFHSPFPYIPDRAGLILWDGRLQV